VFRPIWIFITSYKSMGYRFTSIPTTSTSLRKPPPRDNRSGGFFLTSAGAGGAAGGRGAIRATDAAETRSHARDLYVVRVSRKTLHLFLVTLLVFLQGAQAAFSGATVCREASGKIALEWSGVPCGSAEDESFPCGNEGLGAGTRAESCEACLDVSVSSEQPLKSPALSFDSSCLAGGSLVLFVLPAPIAARVEPVAVPRHPACEHLRSIRLLI
jgi:hypothetical protein